MTRATLAAALAEGYDSVQLTHTQEHGIFKYEIIDVRPHRRVLSCFDKSTHDHKKDTRAHNNASSPCNHANDWNASSCPMPAYASTFRSGWQGSRPCRCTATTLARCLHCDGRGPAAQLAGIHLH